jgi:hypothetical protein
MGLLEDQLNPLYMVTKRRKRERKERQRKQEVRVVLTVDPPIAGTMTRGIKIKEPTMER